MINGYPLNAAPLNSLLDGPGGSDYETQPINPPGQLPGPAEPVPEHPQYPGFQPIEPPEGYSLPWAVTVTVGGLNVTDRLTGTVTIDREEGASGLAVFDLFYPVGTAVPVELHDSEVMITFTAELSGQQQSVLFTGWVTEPDWDATARIMRVTVTDMLQSRVESMSLSAIDTLTGGLYSDDVFGEADGHWQYARDRMSTRTAALDCDVHARMRVTDWHAKVEPHYLFGNGSTVYQSADVKLSQPDTVIRTLELTLQYRYQRLHRSTETFRWTHPATGGSWGISGFCQWRTQSTEMPTKEMVLSAVTGAGLVPVSADWAPLPATHADPCGTGASWVNNHYPDLLQGFEVEGVRHWTQTVTETYSLTLHASTGKRTERSRHSASVRTPEAEQWNDLPVDDLTGIATLPDTQPGDQPDEDRRHIFISTALARATAEVIDSHRQTRVSWQAPTALTLGIDLVHTLRFDDQHVLAQGKCVRRLDELSIETGSALTTLTIAVMRGGGNSDPLTVPARPAGGSAEHTGGNMDLPSQFGGRFTSPAEYNEELDGFSGQYSAVQSSSLPVFPRRLALTAKEYGEEQTGELEESVNKTYSVAAPDDLLEL